MPRIIVQSEGPQGHVTLTERVGSEELSQEHYARQLMERAQWAAADAERAEGTADGADAARASRPAGTPIA